LIHFYKRNSGTNVRKHGGEENKESKPGLPANKDF